MNKKFLALIITIATLQPGTSSCMLNCFKNPVNKSEDKEIEREFFDFGLQIFNLSNGNDAQKIDKNRINKIIELLPKINQNHTTAIEKLKKHHEIFTDFLVEAIINNEMDLTLAFLNNKTVIDAINCTGEALPYFLINALWLGKLDLIKPLIKLGAKADETVLDKLTSIGDKFCYRNKFFFDNRKNAIEAHNVDIKNILKAAILILDNIDQEKVKEKNNPKSIAEIFISLAIKCLEKDYPHKKLANIFLQAALKETGFNPSKIEDFIRNNNDSCTKIHEKKFDIIYDKDNLKDLSDILNNSKIKIMTVADAAKLFKNTSLNDGDEIITNDAAELLLEKDKDNTLEFEKIFDELDILLNNEKTNKENKEQKQPKKILPPCTTIGKIDMMDKHELPVVAVIVRPDVKIYNK